jgi:hypothetical protein
MGWARQAGAERRHRQTADGEAVVISRGWLVAGGTKRPEVRDQRDRRRETVASGW